MPSLVLALLALAPPTEPGVWLDAPPKPGTVVVSPLEISGETQALEGVLKVELYEVRGATATLVETFEPALPVGTIPFEFRWDPRGARAGTVTIRVVATTLLRGFSAEAPGLVVPAAPAAPHRPAARAEVTAPPVARARVVARPVVAAPVLDDSGRAFGGSAPALPYAVSDPAPPAAPPVTVLAAPPAPAPERNGWVSLAGGLLLLVVSSHLHRALRSQPDHEG